MKIQLFSIIALLFCFIQLHAQEASYDIRFSTHDVDLLTNKLQVKIDVKANVSSPEFNIGEQNYRFSYNEEALANPKISEELMLSGFVSTISSDDYASFSAHTLTTGLGTIVSYNVNLAGGKGYPITNATWVSVGLIEFDILNTNACTELVWYTSNPENFLRTFIGEERFNGIKEEARGGEFENLECLDYSITDDTNLVMSKEEENPIFNTQAIDIYPNPFSTSLTIAFDNKELDVQKISVMNAIGQTVAEFERIAGTSNMELSLEHLEKGTYFLKMTNSDEMVIQKVVKL